MSRHSELFQSTFLAEERKRSSARKLDGAVGRMRRLQEQAWADHDTDDERERQVLALGQQPSDTHEGKPSNVSICFQSQRSQYLRIILDAEKEIARLEGLYEGMLDVDGAVAVTFVRLEQGDLTALSQAHRRILPAPSPSTDGA